MGNIFSGSEIVELGILIEKNGRDFYRTLEKKAGNTEAQDLFTYLATEEEKHIVTFQKILEKIGQSQPPTVYSDEYMAYMQALAREHVFTQENVGTQIAEKLKTDKEAIQVGIGFEEDSIVFYEGMKKVVPSYDQKIVDELILQEQVHLKKLLELKVSI
jgi:rubrerythrin